MKLLGKHFITTFEIAVILSIAAIVIGSINTNSITGLYAGSYIGDLTLHVDKPLYLLTNTATVSANLKLYKFPVTDADVSVNIVRPDGAIIIKSAKTDGGGNIVYRYFLGKDDPKGLYAVIVIAYKNGRSVSSRTTFSVK